MLSVIQKYELLMIAAVNLACNFGLICYRRRRNKTKDDLKFVVNIRDRGAFESILSHFQVRNNSYWRVTSNLFQELNTLSKLEDKSLCKISSTMIFIRGFSCLTASFITTSETCFCLSIFGSVSVYQLHSCVYFGVSSASRHLGM